MAELSLALLERIRALMREHGANAVREAVEFVARLQTPADISRHDKQRLAELYSVLRVTYRRDEFNPFMCLRALVKAGVPPKTCIEILERIQAYRPTHPWAWLNRAMREDYPAIQWGRRGADDYVMEPVMSDAAPPDHDAG